MCYLAVILIFLVVTTRYLMVTARYRTLLLVPTFSMNADQGPGYVRINLVSSLQHVYLQTKYRFHT